MKKLLISLAAVAMVGTSAMAGESTIDKIWVKQDTTVIYFTDGKACQAGAAYGHTADYINRLMATALTAKTSDAIIQYNIEGPACKNVFIK